MALHWGEYLNSSCDRPYRSLQVDYKMTQVHGSKSSHLPSLPVIDLLLLLLYLIIVCDVLYIIFVYYVAPTTVTAKRRIDRLHLVKKTSSGQVNVNKKKILTIDHLWRRLKAEARHIKAMTTGHRMITQAMMESRLQARSLERERNISRNAKSQSDEKEDQNIAMAQWAARIVAEHDPRRK